ncbi:MAG: MFS transporter [Verrucomicrobiota bacterium]
MNLFESKAPVVGLLAAAAVVAGLYFGSHGLRHFDPAVAGYALGAVLAALAVGYRFTVWAQRPPSRMYFTRGLQLLLRRNSKLQISHFKPPAPTVELSRSLVVNFAAQRFIQRRSVYRWIMHLCLSGGCTLAFAITFPLVFGWVHFETLPDNAEMYRAVVFGFAVDQFSVHSAKATVIFNLLNGAAVIVLVGLVMAAVRRATDAGERATQNFSEDILPLVLIFAVTATGLMLTVSYKFLAGRGYSLIAAVHMVSVIALLFYIPFGKLFHMFQRACSLCVSLYKKAGETGERAHCSRCGVDSGSQMQINDLKIVLDQLGFNYRFATPHGEVHYQDICPACRRKLLALNQGKILGR